MHKNAEREREKQREKEGLHLPGPIFSYDQVKSTLDTARALVREDRLPEWGSVWAGRQTSGRGQLRRRWISPPGNLYAALRLPAVPPLTESAAAPVVGALLVRSLQSPSCAFRLKWPNDLVVVRNGMPYKVGGILLEEYAGAVLAGIGINILSSPDASTLRKEHAMPASHLTAVVPEFTNCFPSLSPRKLWNRLVSGIYFWYVQQLSLSVAWRHMAEEFLLWRGNAVTLDDDGRLTDGTLVGLGPSGGACLSHDGRTEEFLSGSLTAAAGTQQRP